MKDNSTAQHPLAKMTRLDEELGLYDDGARVPYAGLEGAEDWEVGPCVNHLGNVTSWDICVPREPNATGVGVVASVYSGEKVARAILAAIKDNIEMTRAPVSQDAEQLVERLLEELDGWEQAYPLSAFPEPDLKMAAALLKAGGMTLDAVSASNMRHVVCRLAPKVRETIEALTRVQPSTGLDMGAQHE